MKQSTNVQQRVMDEVLVVTVERSDVKHKLAQPRLLNASDEPYDYELSSSATFNDHLLNPNYVLGYN